MNPHDETKTYRWETGYEKTWESIKDDADKDIFSDNTELKQKSRRDKHYLPRNNLCIMRYLFILLDCTEYMSLCDLKPSRFLCTIKILNKFAEEFYDQNPIGQLGLIVLYNKWAETIVDLTGSIKGHKKALSSVLNIVLTGEPSMYNGLNMAYKKLKGTPSYASKEILLIIGSLSTCDPINVNVTIDLLNHKGVRCSVISLSAEMHICRVLAQRTGGVYNAVLDDDHYWELMVAHVNPPPTNNMVEVKLIRMGFPHNQSNERKPPLSMCVCHVKSIEEPNKLTTKGYYCPQCYSKYCNLPTECQTCGLTLVLAPHLTRSYHHLFPVRSYMELIFNAQAAACYACQRSLSNKIDKYVYRCHLCTQIFCFDCDSLIHDTLHFCIGCSTKANTNLYFHLQKSRNNDR